MTARIICDYDFYNYPFLSNDGRKLDILGVQFVIQWVIVLEPRLVSSNHQILRDWRLILCCRYQACREIVTATFASPSNHFCKWSMELCFRQHDEALRAILNIVIKIKYIAI